MAERISAEQRHLNMQRIKGHATKLEVAVRRYVFHEGFRFRKNDNSLPGTPDVVLPKYKTVIFVNGCFWHQHEGCKRQALPTTRREFWKRKLTGNVVNDKLNGDKLRDLGWSVITVWQCELEKDFNGVMKRLVDIIKENI